MMTGLFTFIWIVASIVMFIMMFVVVALAWKAGPVPKWSLIIAGVVLVLVGVQKAGYLPDRVSGYGYPFPETVQNVINQDPNVSEEDVPKDATDQRRWLQSYRAHKQRDADRAKKAEHKRSREKYIESEIKKMNAQRISAGQPVLIPREIELLRPALSESFDAQRKSY
jgi:hypothetical protein